MNRNCRDGARSGKHAGRLNNKFGHVGAEMFTDEAWTAIAKDCQLSPRELQIIRGIFDNQTDHAIASSLGISRHTIHTYLSRLFRKLNATTRTQVVLRVTRQFLILSASTSRELPPICWRAQSCRRAARIH